MLRRTTAILAGWSIAAVGVLSTGTVAHAADRSTIPDSRPSWATTQNKVADAAATAKLVFRLYLNLPDQAGAEAAAQAVSSPDSASFRRYLTPQQVRQRFAPTDASVAKVRSWLAGAGFTITGTASNNLYVEAHGSVAQAQQAFGVNLGMYRVAGKTLRAPAQNLNVPASIAPLVAG